jgi:hypothetical protein
MVTGPLMRRRRARGPGSEAGFSVGVVLIFTFVMMVTVLALFTIGSQDASLVMAGVRKSQALFLAESGVEVGQGYLEAQDRPPETTDLIYPVGEDPVQLGAGSFDVHIEPDPSNPTSSDKLYTIVGTGYADGRERRIEALVTPDYYSNYLYFTDTEHEPGGGGTVWFTSADVVDGPLFTNDQISICGDPTFMDVVFSAYGGPDDKVTSHNPAFLYYNGDSNNHVESAAASNAPYDNPTFSEGYMLGDTAVDYPTHTVAFDVRALANAGGISISGNYIVELSRIDPATGQPMYGYVSYHKDGQPWTDLPLDSFNGIFYVNGSISVSGVLDGELTLATNGGVTITDDLTYRASDENGPLPDCDDLLGIVAGTDINIAWNEANSDDCVIHAAMIALDNCFRAENWNVGDPRGTLTVWGSIIQSFRGSVGTGYIDDEGNLVVLTGYAKDYHYDLRLLEDLPPAFHEFAQTGMYVRLSWDEIPVCSGDIVPLE